ncbi:MAG: thiamine-phosphate kinase [Motiliproteus sp.]
MMPYDKSDNMRAVKVSQVGERYVTKMIAAMLNDDSILIGEIGHDAAFVNIAGITDDILVVNTDRSGINIAYKLGLSNAECVGDFAISHAVSDIVAAGGTPKYLTIALLLPADTTLEFVRDLIVGAKKSAERYGAIIIGGDTKSNESYASVVTATGYSSKNRILPRNRVRPGDYFMVTGNLGTALTAKLSHKYGWILPNQQQEILNDALIYQRPPFSLGQAISKSELMNSCTDISDGLAGALYNLCDASAVGAILIESNIPIEPDVKKIIGTYGIRSIEIGLGTGDWQYLYAISPDRINELAELLVAHNEQLYIIGTATEDKAINVVTLEKDIRMLKRLEQDTFRVSRPKTHYFSSLDSDTSCLGESIESIDDESIYMVNSLVASYE